MGRTFFICIAVVSDVLTVDRSASPYAGLRSANVGQNNDEENHQGLKTMRSRQIVPFLRRAAASFNKALLATAAALGS
jgi:hypothetical protein